MGQIFKSYLLHIKLLAATETKTGDSRYVWLRRFSMQGLSGASFDYRNGYCISSIIKPYNCKQFYKTTLLLRLLGEEGRKSRV